MILIVVILADSTLNLDKREADRMVGQSHQSVSERGAPGQHYFPTSLLPRKGTVGLLMASERIFVRAIRVDWSCIVTWPGCSWSLFLEQYFFSLPLVVCRDLLTSQSATLLNEPHQDEVALRSSMEPCPLGREGVARPANLFKANERL